MAAGDNVATQFKTFWAQMSLARRALTIGLLAGTLGLLALMIVQARRANYQVLFSDLDQTDAAAIVEQLRTRGVPYQLGGDGAVIRVPADQVSELRIDLAAQGLPSGGSVGFDIFDRSALGWTDFMQRQNLVRALQGELARTIRGLAMVQSARVHVSLPEESVFLSERSQPTASVLVRLKPGQRLSDRQVQGIIQLVAHAVPDLTPERVTVVDADRGESLIPAAQDPLAEKGSFQERLRRGYEEQRARDIVAVLEPLVGEGHVIARVAATFDFSEQLTEARTLDRPVNSRVVTEMEINGVDQPQPEGVAGSDTELNEEQIAALTQQGGQVSRRSETDYQAGETRTMSTQPAGRLVRQTASVIIHHRAVTQPGEKPDDPPRVTYEPWTDEDLTRFDRLVRTAIGFNEDAGDQVTVVSLPFLDPQGDPFGDETFETIAQRQWLLALVRLGLLALGAAALFFLILRPVTRQVIRPALLAEGMSPAALLGARVGDLEQLQAQMAAGQLPRGPGEGGGEEIKAAPSKDDALNRSIRELAEQNPSQAAQIIKSWLEGGT